MWCSGSSNTQYRLFIWNTCAVCVINTYVYIYFGNFNVYIVRSTDPTFFSIFYDIYMYSYLQWRISIPTGDHKPTENVSRFKNNFYDHRLNLKNVIHNFRAPWLMLLNVIINVKYRTPSLLLIFRLDERPKKTTKNLITID